MIHPQFHEVGIGMLDRLVGGVRIRLKAGRPGLAMVLAFHLMSVVLVHVSG